MSVRRSLWCRVWNWTALLLVLVGTGIPAVAAPDQLVLECGPPWGGGDRISSYGFYVPSLPADHLGRVEMSLISWTAGEFRITLEAREGAFDGRLLGIATTQVAFPDANPVPASFDFIGAPVPRDSRITFKFGLPDGGDPTIFFDAGPCAADPNCDACGGKIIETAGTDPPLGDFARNSVYAKIYAPPCAVTCETDAPQRGATGSPLTFRAEATATDCTGGWSFEWDFGDGTPHGFGSPVDHAYAAAGLYTWTFTASLGGASCAKVGIVRIGKTLFASAAGSGDACTQESPCGLQTALSGAAQGDTVVLAGGSYGSSSAQVAEITDHIALVGGWDGAPAGPPDIDCENPPTILDGENQRRGILVAPGNYPFLECLTVTRGKSSGNGGGILAEGANLSMANVRVTNCLADSGGATDTHGGGVYLSGGSLRVADCFFLRNAANCSGCSAAKGGAIAVQGGGRLQIDATHFEQNGAWKGGAVFVEGTPTTVADSSFISNGYDSPVTAAYGSAILVRDGSCSILRVSFDSNWSGDRGVIYLEGSDASISETSITRNNAWTDPGVYTSGGALRMVNCLVADNATTNPGEQSALSLNGTAVLLHNTIARNTGPGGCKGVTLGWDVPYTLRDNIVVGHKTGIANWSYSGVILDQTLWGSGIWANETDLAGSGFITRTGDITGDPLFSDPGAGDYHLAVGSAAQDAGINAGVFLDLDGKPRPQGAGFDIGAYEIQVGVPLQAYLNMDHNTGAAPLDVAFSGGYAGGSPMYTFEWDFGDGSPHSAEQSPQHTYGVPGTYTVLFTVRDGFGVATMATPHTVTVLAPCTLDCSATVPTAAKTHEVVSFRAEASPSGCSGTPTFAWAFGDGSTSAEPFPTHAYASTGTFDWTLEVSVDGKTCARSGSITVTPGLPGDCNGDGTVSIGEVQKAINMFLGMEPPACGVDCSGDGTVSIGEVQKVINAFLGLAASC